MGRHARLADESFLPDMTPDEIRQKYLEERDVRNGRKLLLAYHYKSGKTLREAAEITCTEYETARRWIAAMRKKGSAAIPHRKSPGAPRILTRDQRIRLVRDVHRGPRACGFKTNTWSYRLIHKHVVNKFGVKIAYRTLVNNLHELNVVIKSPRTAHPNEATPEERANFQRDTRKSMLHYARKGYLPMFFDEAYVQSYKNARRTIGIKGDKTTVPSSTERVLLPVLGVLGDGFYYLRVTKKANTATFKEYCERLFELFGPVGLVLDHAGFHKSDAFEEFAEENWRYLERYFTLKYTPSDNAIEGQWIPVKNALSNVSIRSRDHMIETLDKAVRAGEVPAVAVYDYARVGTRRLSPREARAIESKLVEGEYFWYKKTEPPSRIRLPTAGEVRRKKKSVLTPKMRSKLPRRLANSGLPDKYLANPPELLLRK